MQLKANSQKAAYAAVIALFILTAHPGWAVEEAAPAPDEEELIIVKYGSVFVKCDDPTARIYIDDSYKGDPEEVIEGVVSGEHSITCKAGEKIASGSFHVRKNETLRLEANLEEGKIVREKAKAEAQETAEKKKPEPAKQEKPKKPAPVAPKTAEKNPVEERRRAHLNVMKITYEVTPSQEVKAQHAANDQVISKFSLDRDKSGKYYHTKQGVLLCEAGPCEFRWSAKFLYTDEKGKEDALLLKWTETVFNGATPAGTSKQELECCLNGQCWQMKEKPRAETQEFSIGDRYRLVWNRSSVVIRRADIAKEILEAGRPLSDY